VDDDVERNSSSKKFGGSGTGVLGVTGRNERRGEKKKRQDSSSGLRTPLRSHIFSTDTARTVWSRMVHGPPAWREAYANGEGASRDNFKLHGVRKYESRTLSSELLFKLRVSRFQLPLLRRALASGQESSA
jgi:hypothetical protein